MPLYGFYLDLWCYISVLIILIWCFLLVLVMCTHWLWCCYGHVYLMWLWLCHSCVHIGYGVVMVMCTWCDFGHVYTLVMVLLWSCVPDVVLVMCIHLLWCCYGHVYLMWFCFYIPGVIMVSTQYQLKQSDMLYNFFLNYIDKLLSKRSSMLYL